MHQYQERDGEEERKPGKDSCKRDMESVGLKEEDALDRTKWKNDIHNHSGDPRWWKHPRKRKRCEETVGNTSNCTYQRRQPSSPFLNLLSVDIAAVIRFLSLCRLAYRSTGQLSHQHTYVTLLACYIRRRIERPIHKPGILKQRRSHAYVILLVCFTVRWLRFEQQLSINPVIDRTR